MSFDPQEEPARLVQLYTKAVSDVTSGVDAHDLLEQYIAHYLDHYDKATIYRIGKLMERIRHTHAIRTLNDDDVRAWVGDKNWDRGIGYQSRVKNFDVHADSITAQVEGSDEDYYDVWVGLAEGKIVASQCTCPVWQNVCKHIAATLMHFIDSDYNHFHSPLNELTALLQNELQ